MKKFLIFLLVVCGAAYGQNGQETEIIEHEVKAGETMRLISQKYLVPPSDIYQLNKFAYDGISQGMVLQIPVSKSIAKKHKKPTGDIEVEAVEAIMDSLDQENINLSEKAEGSAGPSSSVSTAEPTIAQTAPTSNSPIEHKVVQGETLSALSRKYGVSVNQIRAQNEKLLKGGLKAGQVLTITMENAVAPQVTSDTKSEAVTEAAAVLTEGQIIEHTVTAKETLYSISKKYGVSVEDLQTQNQTLLARGLQAGQVIRIRKN